MQREKRAMICIRNLPGFDDIEAKTRIYYNPNQPTPPEFDKAVSALSKATFGIVENDAREAAAALYDDLYENDKEETEADTIFLVGWELVDRSDDDAMDALKRLGVDFSDARGCPLQSTRFFKFQALAAATGRCGTMPDPEAVQARRLETSLADEARAFMERKRRA